MEFQASSVMGLGFYLVNFISEFITYNNPGKRRTVAIYSLNDQLVLGGDSSDQGAENTTSFVK